MTSNEHGGFKHEKRALVFLNCQTSEEKMNLIYKDESYRIIGAAMKVYNILGQGFVERVYQEALQKEFDYSLIPYAREKEIDIYYNESILDIKFRPDFICYDTIIVELKAVKNIEDIHRAQLLNYLKATKFHLGFLFNFGSIGELQYERRVL